MPSPQIAQLPGPTARRSGFERILSLFLRDAAVRAVTELSPHFRLVELEGEALRDVDWRPGQQIQIGVGSGLLNRTYTPMHWDRTSGRTQFVAFLHGEGPGCDWLRRVQPGQHCMLMGPRASLDLAGLPPQAALFGDETCVSLAASWRTLRGAGAVQHVFEVSDAAESRSIIEALGIENVVLVERRADDSQLDIAEAELLELAARGTRFALAGRAPSIQRIKRALRTVGIGSSGAKAKAYWAPGKTGLD